MKAQNLAAIINSSRTAPAWMIPHFLLATLSSFFYESRTTWAARMMREMRLYSRESSFCCFKKRKEGRGGEKEEGRRRHGKAEMTMGKHTHTYKTPMKFKEDKNCLETR